MSIVPLQYFRITVSYIVNLETGENTPTLLPPWLYQKLIADENYTCLRVNFLGKAKEAKETTGNAVGNH
jgi:hypothetical protein